MNNVFVLIYRTWRTLLQPLIVVDFAEDLEAEEAVVAAEVVVEEEAAVVVVPEEVAVAEKTRRNGSL